VEACVARAAPAGGRCRRGQGRAAWRAGDDPFVMCDVSYGGCDVSDGGVNAGSRVLVACQYGCGRARVGVWVRACARVGVGCERAGAGANASHAGRAMPTRGCTMRGGVRCKRGGTMSARGRDVSEGGT
jgi:hypothetical protein